MLRGKQDQSRAFVFLGRPGLIGTANRWLYSVEVKGAVNMSSAANRDVGVASTRKSNIVLVVSLPRSKAQPKPN